MPLLRAPSVPGHVSSTMDDQENTRSGHFHDRGGGPGPEDQHEAGALVFDPVSGLPIVEGGVESATDADREWVDRALSGDPFGIREACGRYQDEMAFLIDPERHLVWAVGLLGQLRPKGGAVEELGDLVDQCAEQALLTITTMDEELQRTGWRPGPDGDPRFNYLMEAFVLAPGQCLEAQVGFNTLAGSVRKAFFALALHGRSVAECLEEGLGLTKQQLLKWVEQGMRALTRPGEESDG